MILKKELKHFWMNLDLLTIVRMKKLWIINKKINLTMFQQINYCKVHRRYLCLTKKTISLLDQLNKISFRILSKLKILLSIKRRRLILIPIRVHQILLSLAFINPKMEVCEALLLSQSKLIQAKIKVSLRNRFR